MCLSGVQVRTRLASRLKHAGMTTIRRSKLRGMNPQRFKRKMLYDSPVWFYRFSEGDIAAARQTKGT